MSLGERRGWRQRPMVVPVTVSEAWVPLAVPGSHCRMTASRLLVLGERPGREGGEETQAEGPCDQKWGSEWLGWGGQPIWEGELTDPGDGLGEGQQGEKSRQGGPQVLTRTPWERPWRLCRGAEPGAGHGWAT